MNDYHVIGLIMGMIVLLALTLNAMLRPVEDNHRPQWIAANKHRFPNVDFESWN